jgi:disulfide oxidoreductase YuzD
MDPVTMIVGALATAVANLAEPAVKDAYEGLKGLIKRKFSDDATVQVAVDNLEDNPEVWRAPAEDALQKANAGEDPEILAAVEALQAKLNELQASGKIVHTGTGDILTDQARKIDTGGGDYVEGGQTKYEGGSTHIQQDISGVSGGTIIGQQNIHGEKDD